MDGTKAPSAVLGFLVQPDSDDSIAQKSTKTMQQLLNEIDQAKVETEASLRTLEKIDTRRKQAVNNPDRLADGRTQIKRLSDRVIDLQHQMDRMSKESDPTWPVKTFDRSKKNALQILANLSNQLNQVDQHLEKAISTTRNPSSSSSTAASEEENSKGLGALIRKLPIGNVSSTPSTAVVVSRTASSTSNDADEGKSNEVVVSGSKPGPQSSSQVDGYHDQSEDDDSDVTNDSHRLLTALQSQAVSGHQSNLSNNNNNQLRSISPPPSDIRQPIVQAHSTSSSSSSRQEIPDRHRPISIPATQQQEEESDDDTNFGDDVSEKGNTDNDEEEEQEESVHRHDTTDDDEEVEITSAVQKLRAETYEPGTRFRVIHNFVGSQSGDLSVSAGEILVLVEQPPDNWWLFENPLTHAQGLVPINSIELESSSPTQRFRSGINPATSASTLVDAFKMNNDIPSGFIASYLAPLTQQRQYKLSQILIPKMTKSNLDFADLHWGYDTEQIRTQQVEYQKILTIKKCTKIPKIKRDQIRVFSRCLRLCLYDGYEIVSNICAIRAQLSKTDRRNFTEDWSFAANNASAFIDEQPEFLIRSNQSDPSKQLYVLLELSQLCQSTVSEERCEVGCGWIIISLVDDQPAMFSETKSFNNLLQGGHIHQANTLLSSSYKKFRSEGLGGRIDRSKQARIQYSLESRESQTDLLYDNLPVTSMIIPTNLVQSLVLYRNELAYQLRRRSQSSKPVDSIFLSTFKQVLEQPDLIFVLKILYRRHRGSSIRRQKEEFIQIYERSIYPLLCYRSLPAYDFQNITVINERRVLIKEMINKQLSNDRKSQPDILAILLDPQLTDKWTPFTTDEICFSLQKY